MYLNLMMVTSRKGRVSRNVVLIETFYSNLVTSRKGRVSRNETLVLAKEYTDERHVPQGACE